MSEAAAPRPFGLGPGFSGVLSDDRLARRATAGDKRAFAAIFNRYHQDLYRFCMAIVGDSADAQDALQNTMVKVLRTLPGEAREIKLKPWLYRIAHNESVEMLRRRRGNETLDGELAVTTAGPAETAVARERLRRLIVDLEQLPERQRGALVMRELADLDFGEIGAALGTTPAVARQTLYEARQSLRQMAQGREMSCETVQRALSDGDGRVTRRRDVKAHLRSCPDCTAFREGIEARRGDLAALSPLPAVAAAGLLQGVLGGHTALGGGLAGLLGGGAGQAVGTGVLLKSAATVAVVAAVGVTAADRSGLVDTGLPGGSSGGAASPSSSPEAPGQPGGSPGPQTAAGTDGDAAGTKADRDERGKQARPPAKVAAGKPTPAGAAHSDESGPNGPPAHEPQGEAMHGPPTDKPEHPAPGDKGHSSGKGKANPPDTPGHAKPPVRRGHGKPAHPQTGKPGRGAKTAPHTTPTHKPAHPAASGTRGAPAPQPTDPPQAAEPTPPVPQPAREESPPKPAKGTSEAQAETEIEPLP
jgi:RNA polymerase sigma factor (sigma-70 family)